MNFVFGSGVSDTVDSGRDNLGRGKRPTSAAGAMRRCVRQRIGMVDAALAGSDAYNCTRQGRVMTDTNVAPHRRVWLSSRKLDQGVPRARAHGRASVL